MDGDSTVTDTKTNNIENDIRRIALENAVKYKYSKSLTCLTSTEPQSHLLETQC